MGRQSIRVHEGKKYLKMIHPAINSDVEPTREYSPIPIDVYAVLIAFDVTCPATAHAIKKLLCAGQRGKGDRLADLQGAMSALNRAIDLAESEAPAPSIMKPPEIKAQIPMGTQRRLEIGDSVDTDKGRITIVSFDTDDPTWVYGVPVKK